MELIESQSGPEWKPHVPDKFELCDCCGEVAVVETIEDESFVYGDGEERAMLTAVVPVLSCQACGMQWTDHRGEALRDAAVQEHQETSAVPEPRRRHLRDQTELQAAAAVLANANRLWRDADARARFEMETGQQPIISGIRPEVEAQHQSGRTAEYHARFMEWAADQSQ